jgi:hypothetical protein
MKGLLPFSPRDEIDAEDPQRRRAPHAEAIHEARKSMKRARAPRRLVREALGNDEDRAHLATFLRATVT